MATVKQKLGDWGERLVASKCPCPSCKREKTTKLLPPNFKCADLICDFCGYISQVKTTVQTSIEALPNSLLGAAWGPQRDRMEASIYFPLYVVVTTKKTKQAAIYFLSSDLQTPAIFKPRNPLSETAKRAGWRGFMIDLTLVKDRFVRLL
jgi:hypothetical protein